MTIARAVTAYERAMLRLPPEHRGFLSMSKSSGRGEKNSGNSFNYIALWTFIDELTQLHGGGTVIPLPVLPPSLMSTMHKLVETRKWVAEVSVGCFPPLRIFHPQNQMLISPFSCTAPQTPFLPLY